MIWVETGSTASPIARATCASTWGSICANVPTAPEMAQVATFVRARIEPFLGAEELRIGIGELDTKHE